MMTISSYAVARDKAKARPKPNTLTKRQLSQGWKLLFDGKTLDGFKGATNYKVLNTCWKVQNGQIICTERDQRPDKLGGSIVAKDLYSSFDFRLDYKLDPDFKGGHVNSGIKYFAYPNTELGLEYQIYDAEGSGKATGALAALYDIMPTTEKPAAKPRGKWNRVRILARGNHVEHWLNGRKVLSSARPKKAAFSSRITVAEPPLETSKSKCSAIESNQKFFFRISVARRHSSRP